MKYDVFISYASEDRARLVEPVVMRLKLRRCKIWYDQMALSAGDNLPQGIGRGLITSKYALVFLSPTYLEKAWTNKELDTLVAIETRRRKKLIIPILDHVDLETVAERVPLLAEKVAILAEKGIPHIVNEVMKLFRRNQRKRAARSATTPNIRGSDSIQHVMQYPRSAVAHAALESVWPHPFGNTFGARTSSVVEREIQQEIDDSIYSKIGGRPLSTQWKRWQSGEEPYPYEV